MTEGEWRDSLQDPSEARVNKGFNETTEEQQAILDATGRVLLVNVRAGTEKTATLRMISSAHPDRKILYLVFNRKAREEAEEKFPGNVRVSTVHSLAFEAKWKDRVGPFTVADMLPGLQGPEERSPACRPEP
ncbi:MAG: hypothetical protein C4576_00495 [Desulfobacteraceae bacterium]|nr:MAG: hypothetical protein C4576_00495 [Desulfobacteraceae bacterium]